MAVANIVADVLTGPPPGDFILGDEDFLDFGTVLGSKEGDDTLGPQFDLLPDGQTDFSDFLLFVLTVTGGGRQ